MGVDRLLLLLPGFLIGLTVHEAAHAITAKWFGDDTAERMGRVSLNPLRHLSPMGTAALFFLGFGWGRPVIVNIHNFRKPKLHYLLSSLAGPASNLILCGVALGVLYLRPIREIGWICLSIILTRFWRWSIFCRYLRWTAVRYGLLLFRVCRRLFRVNGT